MTNKINQYVKWISISSMVSISLFIIFMTGSMSGYLSDDVTLSGLGKYYENNNLVMIDEKDILGVWESDKSLYEWELFVKSKYYYTTGGYDCKYWALVWALYFEKHNVNYQFTLLDKHIFVVADYPDKYCIADADNLDCVTYNK